MAYRGEVVQQLLDRIRVELLKLQPRPHNAVVNRGGARGDEGLENLGELGCSGVRWVGVGVEGRGGIGRVSTNTQQIALRKAEEMTRWQ